METENDRQHNPAPRPHRPGITPRPVHPAGRRPMVDGFAPRRPLAPSLAPAPRPVMPPAAGHPAVPAHHQPAPSQQPIAVAHPAHNAHIPHSAAAPAPQPQAPAPRQHEFVPELSDDTESPKSAKPPKEHSDTGHAGLVGFIVFTLLGALLLSPFVPGKILQDFPLSSSNFSSGGQALACSSALSNVSSRTSYDTKAGAPLTYRYATSTTQTADCNGKPQSAVTSRTSQFSPLALLADIAIALAVAIIVARIWRKIFGEKRSRR